MAYLLFKGQMFITGSVYMSVCLRVDFLIHANTEKLVLSKVNVYRGQDITTPKQIAVQRSQR